ncbi:hypothetical protein [Tunturiibacter lichenicola]|jgi:hypothetical protein|uniref:hypothetical protein n=1 Tax=Tunturiibacter lichenicola TaxID=2051959 RepID=UPI003D9B2CE8
MSKTLGLGGASYYRECSSGMPVFEVSSKTGFGADSVLDFLSVQLALTHETQVEASL